MTASAPYFDKRRNRWTVTVRRGAIVENHRFHREDQAHAFLSEWS